MTLAIIFHIVSVQNLYLWKIRASSWCGPQMLLSHVVIQRCIVLADRLRQWLLGVPQFLNVQLHLKNIIRTIKLWHVISILKFCYVLRPYVLMFTTYFQFLFNLFPCSPQVTAIVLRRGGDQVPYLWCQVPHTVPRFVDAKSLFRWIICCTLNYTDLPATSEHRTKTHFRTIASVLTQSRSPQWATFRNYWGSISLQARCLPII